MSSIEIQLNGEPRSIKSGTISELLSELELQNKKIAVELNRAIVSHTAYETTQLIAGDQLEIIHFVGGG